MRASASAALLWLLCAAPGCAGSPPALQTAATPKASLVATPAASAGSTEPISGEGEEEDAAPTVDQLQLAIRSGAGFGSPPIVGPPRPKVTPIRFRLGDLPVVEVPRALEVDPKATTPPKGSSKTPDELIGRSAFMQMSRLVTMSPNPFAVGGCHQDDTGALTDGRSPWLPARWESARLVRGAKGRRPSYEYTIVDGWYDQRTCRPTYMRKTSATASEIVPDLLYGLRAHCAECSDRDTVVFLVHGARAIVSSRVSLGEAIAAERFGRAIVPIRRGGAESVLAAVDTRGAGSWPARLKVDSFPEMRFKSTQPEILVDIEVSQGQRDAEPYAVVYLGVVERPTNAREHILVE